MFIIIGIFHSKGYRNKTYYARIISIIALLGLNTLYGLLFVPLDNFDNYLNIVAFIGLLIIFSLAYFRDMKRKKNSLKEEGTNLKFSWIKSKYEN